jgi:mycothiol synthase
MGPSKVPCPEAKGDIIAFLMESPSDVRIDTADASGLATYCDLWNQVWPDHELALDELLRDRQILPPEQLPTVWIARSSDEPVGFATAYRYVGEYHPQKWNIAVGVLTPWRKRGFGKVLFQTASEFVESQDPISIATRTSDQDPESIGFAMRRGFAEYKRDFESELLLDSFDPDAHQPEVDSEVVISPASAFDTLERRREFHELFETVRVDVPRVEPPVRLSFEKFEQLVLDDPQFSWEMTQVATVNGQMIGFSGLYTMATIGLLEQWLTATHREFRGRKIALALKVAATRKAKELGYKRIRTNNDTRNGPMLAINDRMGYVRLPGTITFLKRFDP